MTLPNFEESYAEYSSTSLNNILLSLSTSTLQRPTTKKLLYAFLLNPKLPSNSLECLVNSSSMLIQYFQTNEKLYIAARIATLIPKFASIGVKTISKLGEFSSKVVNQLFGKFSVDSTNFRKETMYLNYFQRIYFSILVAYSSVLANSDYELEEPLENYEKEMALVSITEYLTHYKDHTIYMYSTLEGIKAITGVQKTIQKELNHKQNDFINKLLLASFSYWKNEKRDDNNSENTIILQSQINDAKELNLPFDIQLNEMLEKQKQPQNISFYEEESCQLPFIINESAIIKHEQTQTTYSNTSMQTTNYKNYITKILQTEMMKKDEKRCVNFISMYTILKNIILPSLTSYKSKIKKLIPGCRHFTNFVPVLAPYRILILVGRHNDSSSFKYDLIKAFNKYRSEQIGFKAYINVDNDQTLLIQSEIYTIQVVINKPHQLFTRNLIRKYIMSSKLITNLAYYLLCFGSKKGLIDSHAFTYQGYLLFIIYFLQNLSTPLLPTISLDQASTEYIEYFALGEISNKGDKVFKKIPKNKKRLKLDSPSYSVNSSVQNLHVGQIAYTFFEVLNRIHLLRFTKISITHHLQTFSNLSHVFIENPYYEDENEVPNFIITICPEVVKEEDKKKRAKPIFSPYFKRMVATITNAFNYLKLGEYSEIMMNTRSQSQSDI